MKMPAIFVGHGSPMNAVEDNKWTNVWRELGRQFNPKGILVISAHWYTNGRYTQDSPNPRKINDMYGFPEQLYKTEYPVTGDPELTRSVLNSLGEGVSVNNEWGIDHGSWSVLLHMYSKAEIPVVQLSVDYSASAADQYETGKCIAHLRNEGYMIIGSGNVVHNLGRINMSTDKPYAWAVDFDNYIKDAILKRKFDKCVNYRMLGETAELAVPTPDHYYPLLTVLGAAMKSDDIGIFNEAYTMGSLSMTGYVFK